MQFRSPGLAGVGSRGSMLIELLLPRRPFGKKKAWETYDVAGELPSSSL